MNLFVFVFVFVLVLTSFASYANEKLDCTFQVNRFIEQNKTQVIFIKKSTFNLRNDEERSYEVHSIPAQLNFKINEEVISHTIRFTLTLYKESKRINIETFKDNTLENVDEGDANYMSLYLKSLVSLMQSDYPASSEVQSEAKLPNFENLFTSVSCSIEE
jgi:hypothetical protein